jgi:NADPH:quinone reductase-like Zn-dependent oxidoreductase
MYMLQVLRHWGYRKLLTVASARNHPVLLEMGASVCFDYSEGDFCQKILAVESEIPYILDCIGSLENTLRPLTKIAKAGSKLAVMLPVILRDATIDNGPLYEMDAENCLKGEWEDGVEVRGGVRTRFYQDVGVAFP